jgi:hypothetical protein
MSTGLCTDCGTGENIVYSGVDAFVLGVTELVERICYTCANNKARAH